MKFIELVQRTTLVISIYATLLANFAQAEPTGFETLSVDVGADGTPKACGFVKVVDQVYISEKATPEIQAIVDRVKGPFPPNLVATRTVHVFQGDVQVAAAFIHNNDAFLVYNPVQIQDLINKRGEAAVWAVFAHELSHIYFDDWENTSPRKDRERIADRNAGRFIQFLGVGRTSATSAIEEFADEKETPEYESKDKRKLDVLLGWDEYCRIRQCDNQSELTEEQRRQARNNIVINPYDVYPSTKNGEFARPMQKMGQALRLLTQQYTSQANLPSIDNDLRNVGFVTAPLGSSVDRANPQTVFDKGAELEALGIVLGSAHFEDGKDTVSLQSSFFVQGNADHLSHEQVVSSEFPKRDIPPFVIANKHLEQSWPKLVVISRIAQLLAENETNPDVIKKDVALRLATQLKTNLTVDDPFIPLVQRYIEEARR
ncbi:hypothetical protein M3P21_18150 [Ruegeria sp. 2012CJ41-6]|uniref:Peptidase M48 domain-containing protein n=1 Tax=Ruegeria spongiae TaxID=2942209 RepID=A0ABT0Q6I9_9RHOB|nr:hypothetical protein [Ruegeria spongiae]MCL6285455.1 hypothetical protein [Ruegeria spongiae]